MLPSLLTSSLSERGGVGGSATGGDSKSNSPIAALRRRFRKARAGFDSGSDKGLVDVAGSSGVRGGETSSTSSDSGFPDVRVHSPSSDSAKALATAATPSSTSSSCCNACAAPSSGSTSTLCVACCSLLPQDMVSTEAFVDFINRGDTERIRLAIQDANYDINSPDEVSTRLLSWPVNLDVDSEVSYIFCYIYLVVIFNITMLIDSSYIELESATAIVCIHTRTHTRTHTSTRAYMHAYMHACVLASMHACIHTYIHISMHTYIHAYMHTYIHAYIHTYMHACRRTYMHTFMHIYVHTYIQ